MIVLLQTRFLTLTIGPDCNKWHDVDVCFAFGFLFFVVISFLLCRTVGSVIKNEWIVLCTYLASLLQCGSYLVVALSNPSVAFREDNSIIEVTEKNAHRVCKKCGAEKTRDTHHCRDCDVCIKGYDHHCPWVSKCIGKGNLAQFYAFVTITPVYIILFMVLMMGCLVEMAAAANGKNLRHHQ